MTPGPMITAVLQNGPLDAKRPGTETVEGRPPKTIDVPADGRTYRYGLADWEQEGTEAAYSFLYGV